MIKRRETRDIKIGNVRIGGAYPIAVQSMCNTDTRNVAATVEQIKKLEKAGCEIIRVAVPDMEAAKALGAIKKKIKIPLVADIHFLADLALEAIEQGIDKLRINPGNIGSEDKIKKVVLAAKKKKIPIRIGVNAGSLEKEILAKYNGKVTARGMVDSAMRHIRILEKHKFSDIVISLKASDIERTVEAYLEVGLIGSCTNYSYEDIARASSVARQAGEKKLKVKSEFIVTPGSEQIRYTCERDGLLQTFDAIGGIVMANACGPCIGQWSRKMDNSERKNSILNSFNRNFAKRNDGNASTHSFIASPEIVTALTLSGTLLSNPLRDTLINEEGKEVKLDEPTGWELPVKGFDVKDAGFLPPLSPVP